MEIDLELYRGENLEFSGRYKLTSFLREAARRLLGDVARNGRIELFLEPPADDEPYQGPPEVRNLATRTGHCLLRVLHDDELVEERRLRTVELLGPVLADELRARHPDEGHWAFRLSRKHLAALLVVGEKILGELTAGRPVPEIQGSVDIDPEERRHRPFTLTPMARADEELVQPERLGLDRDRLEKINILVPGEIHEQLVRGMPLADRMEEGGFLLGRVTRAAEATHLVEITHVTPAHRSGAGLIHFTFTGDSFLAVAQLIEERNRSEELVGWYHTHVHGVDPHMGLSAIDVDLHLATFQRPWQVAALINLREQDRTLRFYGRDEKTLREYHQWISDDSGRYRLANPVLGGD